MHIVICGAGQVGVSIVEHMIAGNDIAVIDAGADRVQRITEAHDVRGIIGVPSHPDILKQAGCDNADLLIAVTESDEVNMIACQVAHSIFGTPMKIGRIRARSYLDPAMGDLYSDDNLPIDHIISPEAEVASTVFRHLTVAGAFDVADMCDGMVNIIGVRCDEKCPILGSPLRQLTGLFEGLNITIAAVLRDNEVVVSRDGSFALAAGDRVYFACDAKDTMRSMASFGHEEPVSRKVVIAGGGTIGRMAAAHVVARTENSRCTLIEQNREIAFAAKAEVPGSVTVINGDALDQNILREGGVADADTFVALTNNDEDNVLSALLAKRHGAHHAVSLVNMASFVPLTPALGIDAVINPPAITVTWILKHVRRGRITDMHSIVENRGEFMEVEAMPGAPLVDKPLREAGLPKYISIAAIRRGEEIIAPRGDTRVEPGDHAVVFSSRDAGAEVVKLFTGESGAFL